MGFDRLLLCTTQSSILATPISLLPAPVPLRLLDLLDFIAEYFVLFLLKDVKVLLGGQELG